MRSGVVEERACKRPYNSTILYTELHVAHNSTHVLLCSHAIDIRLLWLLLYFSFRFAGQPSLALLETGLFGLRYLHDVEFLQTVIVSDYSYATRALCPVYQHVKKGTRGCRCYTLKISTRINTSGSTRSTLQVFGTQFANS